MTTIIQENERNKITLKTTKLLLQQNHLLILWTTMITTMEELWLQGNGQVHGMDHVDMEVGVLKDLIISTNWLK